jgi:hypothetical protein
MYCFTDLYAWVRIGRLKIEWIKKRKLTDGIALWSMSHEQARLMSKSNEKIDTSEQCVDDVIRNRSTYFGHDV